MFTKYKKETAQGVGVISVWGGGDIWMVKNITFEKTYSRVVGSNPDRVFQANHTVSLIQMQNACVHTFLKMKQVCFA
jgi:hypothetical protein